MASSRVTFTFTLTRRNGGWYQNDNWWHREVLLLQLLARTADGLHLRPAVVACGLLLSFLVAALSDSSRRYQLLVRY